ncbi:MAG: DHH family phosphoesterase [Verrucomicrobia bacterium]|jgi:oligoribonuclease NrnB/cAMP/cGMP phosphodiesterase (DHH superfamily)|nr:MAG: DHH family phosphoesterase [Verrucomicrobiota bacterium]
MNSLPQPQVILTHESDLDGFVAGILLQGLAQKLFGTTPRLESFHNHQWKQRSMSEKSAWVADFNFEPRLDRANWVVFDHHATEGVPSKARLLHDPGLSAGAIVYGICREEGLATPALDRLVHLSNIADLFLDKDPEFSLALDYASLIKVYGFWPIHELCGGDLEKVVDHPLLDVMLVKRRVEDPLGYEWSRQQIKEVSPTVGFVNTIVGNTNLIVHQLLQNQATPYKVLLTLYKKSASTMVVSFRSREGEALQVAEKFHGGGHPNAAGATLPKSVQNATDALVYLRQILNPKVSTSPASLNSLEGAFSAINL